MIHDKTFFFASYEGFILRQGTTNLTTVPTAAMRPGDFSAARIPALFDPLSTTQINGVYTRAPFAGNQIPSSRLNPAAGNLARILWPLPNQPGVVNNYQVTYNRPYNYNQLNARLDHVLDLPMGKGHKFPGGVRGPAGKVVSGWAVNGITAFQNGFPLDFIDASNNTLVNNFAVGNAGPGTGAGITRPNFAAGCDPAINGAARARLGAWFNTSCYSVPGPFQFGNEPRVSPLVRAQGVNNFDFSIAKRTGITERMGLEFRTEFFNLFNRVQFSPPNTQPGAAQFGQVTAQYNQPRLVQFALRLKF